MPAPTLIPASQWFNLVILPVTPAGPAQRFQLSAGRRDRALRLVSPAWTASQVRAALGSLSLPTPHIEELFRGNTMAFGPRTRRRMYFTTPQLESIGMAPVPEAAL